MKNTILTFMGLSLAAGLMGCAKSKSSDVMAKPEEVQKASVTGGTIQVEFNPAVDILFVVDNSQSMKDEQAELRKGIAAFVNGFGENSSIDYRAGVVTVYDSGRCGRLYKGKMVDCYPAGQLQPLKTTVLVDMVDAEGKPVFEADGKTPKKIEQEKIGEPGFVTRGEGSAEVLKSTLNVGAMDLDSGGPEFEEMFLPVTEAFNPAMNNGPNKGFIRKNSQVVVIFVSDENDASTVSTDIFVPNLQALLSHPAEKINGADRLSMYGVLALDGCKRETYAASPSRIVKVVNQVNGRVFKICDGNSFASGLKKIGQDIRERLMKSSFVLNGRPDPKTLKVFYGETQLTAGKQWKYNPSTNMIEVRSDLQVQPKPGAKFSAQFDRVSDNAINQGHSTAVLY